MNNLTAWVDDLKRRGCTINITDQQIHIDGPTTPADWTVANRHRHALIVAAAGTNPGWWHHQTGNTTTIPDDIPTAADDPDAYACNCCGQPAAHLDWTLAAWCGDHR